MLPRTITASFDANLAREVGLPAAILYNALIWVAQSEMAKAYNSDGWFYYTATKFEEETAFTKNTYTAAVKTLVDAGYIEKKQKYIKNTSVSVNHYRFLKFYNPDSQQMGIGGLPADGNPYNKKNNKKETGGFTETLSPSPSADFSDLTEEPKADEGGRCKNYNTQGDPFANEVKNVKPAKDSGAKNRYYHALARELMDIVNPLEKDDRDVVSCIKYQHQQGYSDAELKMVAKLSRTLPFYADKATAFVLSKESFPDILAKTKKQKDAHPSWRGLSPF